jgi:diaminohydroxyphosphoribosylaminopyrimidine deaminase / 5-amino-6-(5-phosphoribosylamino)uracil reductase
MDEKEDIKFMRRCLDLASGAEGLTYPNPLVGAVLVCDNKITGEGYHLIAGGPHAEVVAINSVTDSSTLRSSTLYVNLEPCSHFGRTPPCADLIIARQIPRVVIGTPDPSDKVSGKGEQRLRSAGVEVRSGVLEEECRRLNRRFFTFHAKKRPYITLKWAQSADGYLDILRSENDIVQPNWITGKPERSLVHRWRASEQAILVGAGTVRADDPKLNVRDWTGHDPLKIILSSTGNINGKSAMFGGDDGPVVFTGKRDAVIPGAKVITLDEGIPACIQITRYLFDSDIESLMIEGGAKVLEHFISNGLWDEARIFTGPVYFKQGVKAPEKSGELFSKRVYSSSTLEIYLNK